MSKIIPNSYQCPNFYCDELMHLLNGEEWKVLDYTVRRIFGFHKSKDNISLTQYSEGIKDRNGNALDHGTGLSRPTVIEALATLTACKIIFEIEEDSGNKGKCYSLELDSDKVDFAWLNARRDRKRAATSERTAKGRAAAQEKGKVVNPIDQQVVNGIDRGVVNGIDTHSIQEKTSGKPEGKKTIPSPAGCLPILLDTYRNIAKDATSQAQLSWQCQMLESEGVTAAELSEWLKSRRSLSSIKFIGQDFRTWKESAARQNQKQNAATLPKKFCGRCNSGWVMPDKTKGQTHAYPCSCQSKGVSA